jgi:F0F1-type ATP synthase membrane subunit b/b'
MTRDQALKAAQRIWGKRACIRVNSGISSPERRDAATAEANELRARIAEIEAEIARREREAGILELREQVSTLKREKRERLLGDATFYRLQIGFIDSVIGAFNIEAQGDTWEEAFGKAKKTNGGA